MIADQRGAQTLARLLAGLPLGPQELDGLPHPWRDLADALQRAGDLNARAAALNAALAARPDAVALRAAIPAALRPADQAPAAPADALVRLSDVAARPVRWLWPGRLPIGKLTVLDGDPGLGKSALTLDLAARLTAARPMPDGTRPDLPGPRGAVLLSGEDGLADTIRPRLDAAGADPDRVVALTAVVDRQPGRAARGLHLPRLPTLADLDALRRAIADVDAALVVVDPILAYLPREANSRVEPAVRALLTRLAGLAVAEDVALLAVRHLTKAGGRDPLYRGGGSIGIIGAARSGLLVARDPADPTGARRVLASTKANLAGAPASLAYRLSTADNGALRVAWEGPTDHTAASLLERPAAPDRDEPTALAEARDVLAAILADGPRPAAAVLAEARAAGLSPRTVRRARESLGIRPRKDSFRGCWLWALPTRCPLPAPPPGGAGGGVLPAQAGHQDAG